MGLAYPKCPYVVANGDWGYLRENLLKVPGVKISGSRLIIPHHAVELVNEMINGTPVASAGWSGEPPDDTPWEDVESVLRRTGEVREFVLDGFLMPFQKEALQFASKRAGVHFWHPTGAGKTLTL